MMKKIVYAILIIFLFHNCTQIKDWSDPTDSIPPGMVTNPEIENIPGGAIITYKSPDDKDLLGIKAVYSYDDKADEKFEVFSSAYTNSIKLVGFPNTNERTVQLIAIDKSKNESKPLNVQIKPLTLPVDLIRQSLKVSPTFGGLYVTWENITKSDIGISLSYKDSTGVFKHDYTYFSNAKDGKFAFRGFDSTPKEFQFQIQDRWKNYAGFDTIIAPLYEEKIKGMAANGLPVWSRYGGNNSLEWKWMGELFQRNNANNRQFNQIFDGITSASGINNLWNSGPPGNVLSNFTDKPQDDNTFLAPIYFTIDLGRSCKLSRHKVWNKLASIYGDNAIRSYEIWATNEKPKGPSDFATIGESLSYWTAWPEVNGKDKWKEDWFKIADCELTPPSGATNTLDITDEDTQWGIQNGFEFDIFPESTTKSVRYLRIVSKLSWSGTYVIHIGEFELWGAYD